MRGSSQASRDAALRSIESSLTAAGADAAKIAADVFAVVDALDSSGSLRRAMTDPARPGTDKASLVKDLFGSAGARSISVVDAFVESRWSGEADLADALESAGIEALLAVAQSAGKLDTVEEELFRVDRLLTAERDLRVALDDRSNHADARVALLDEVFGKAVSSYTYALLERAARTPRMQRLSSAVGVFIGAAAARRQRAVANVTVAVELSAKQRQRLQGILAKAYGREIQLNVAVEPSVVGGVRVQVGHEVVDGTVLSRLDEVRHKIGG